MKILIFSNSMIHKEFHCSLLSKLGCTAVGIIEVNESHLLLKFQVGPNINFPDTPFLTDHVWSHVELFSPCLA